MRISKQNLAIEQAPTSDDRRSFTQIQGILFERDGSVSTDRFRLVFVPYPEPCDDDDPAVGTVVPIDLARRAATVARWRDRIELTREGGHVLLTISPPGDDGDDDDDAPAPGPTIRLRARVADQPFPAWRSLVPASDQITSETVVDTAYLAEAAEKLREAGCFAVRLRVPGDAQSPLVVEGLRHGEAEGPLVLIMPMRFRDRRHLAPVEAGERADR